MEIQAVKRISSNGQNGIEPLPVEATVLSFSPPMKNTDSAPSLQTDATTVVTDATVLRSSNRTGRYCKQQK